MGSREVTISREGEWFVVSDEGGEFARASTVELTLPYVADLLYGPPTGPEVRDAIVQGVEDFEKWRDSILRD